MKVGSDMRKIAIAFALVSCFVMQASAGPGYEVTSFAVDSMQEPVVVEALKEYAESNTGEDYNGTIILQRHDNDGANPATHSIVALYPSMAVSEAYGKMIQGDKAALGAWMKMVGKISAVSTMTYTSRFARIGSWGTMDDKDSVWLSYSITAKDAASVYRAIDGWMKSDMGKQFPGQLHLAGVVAAGIGGGTHTVVVGYESMAEMESWAAKASSSAGFLQLLHTLSVVSEIHGINLATDIARFGKSATTVFK
jgi:hypothetical protein